MSALTQQRCYLHAAREAAALCLECNRYYCRECVTEHEGRVVCASCLGKLAARAETKRRRWGIAARTGLATASVLAAWFAFYTLGTVLLALPDEFHEGVWLHEARITVTVEAQE